MSFFKTTNPNFVLLFNGWKVSSISVLVGSCVGVFFLSVLSEFVRFKRSKLVRQVPANKTGPPLPNNNSNDVISTQESDDVTTEQSPDELSRSTVILTGGSGASQSKQQECSPFSAHHAVQVILHIAQLILGYLLMLIVMTFNVWLGVAVVLGLGTGYFICHNDYLLSDGSNANTSIQLKIIE